MRPLGDWEEESMYIGVGAIVLVLAIVLIVMFLRRGTV